MPNLILLINQIEMAPNMNMNQWKQHWTYNLASIQLCSFAHFCFPSILNLNGSLDAHSFTMTTATEIKHHRIYTNVIAVGIIYLFQPAIFWENVS